MIPEAAVEAAAEDLYDREGYSTSLADAPKYRRDRFLTQAREVLEAATPHMLADYLLALAADVKIRGDIGKDEGVEAWDYLTRHAELIRPTP